MTVNALEHQEIFIANLKQEINDLRARQRDYSQLADQLGFLEAKYRQSQDDKVINYSYFILFLVISYLLFNNFIYPATIFREYSRVMLK